MKKLYAIALVLAILGLAGCGHRNGEEGDRHAADLAGIEVIQIDHGSTTLHLESADTDFASGHVKLVVNSPEPDLRLKLRSGSGSHSVAIQLQEHRQSKGMTEGSGTHEVSIKTGSGHITVQ